MDRLGRQGGSRFRRCRSRDAGGVRCELPLEHPRYTVPHARWHAATVGGVRVEWTGRPVLARLASVAKRLLPHRSDVGASD